MGMYWRESGLTQDPEGNISANVVPRTGLLTNLMSLSGGVGELSSAIDNPAIVQFSGAPEEAVAYLPNGIYQVPESGNVTVPAIYSVIHRSFTSSAIVIKENGRYLGQRVSQYEKSLSNAISIQDYIWNGTTWRKTGLPIQVIDGLGNILENPVFGTDVSIYEDNETALNFSRIGGGVSANSICFSSAMYSSIGAACRNSIVFEDRDANQFQYVLVSAVTNGTETKVMTSDNNFPELTADDSYYINVPVVTGATGYIEINLYGASESAGTLKLSRRTHRVNSNIVGTDTIGTDIRTGDLTSAIPTFSMDSNGLNFNIRVSGIPGKYVEWKAVVSLAGFQ